MRVLIRRPHAYDFLREHPDVVPQDAVTTRADGSLEVDASKLPIPSICVLDAFGAVRAVVPLNADGARERLLGVLLAEAAPAGSVDAKLKEAIDLVLRAEAAPTPAKEQALVASAVRLFDEAIPLLPPDSDARFDARWKLAIFLPAVDCERAKAEMIALVRSLGPSRAEGWGEAVIMVSNRIRAHGQPEIANSLIREAGPLIGLSNEEIEMLARVR